MFGNWVLDHAEQFLLGGGGADGHAVEELDHEACEAFEGTGNADGRVHLDEDALGSVDVDLKSTNLVDGRVE